MSMPLKGRCMCGAVRVEATPVRNALGACHCDMCRRWTSSMLMTFEAAPGSKVEGSVKVFKSSQWAERAFCEDCGSPLWYRMTAPGPMHGQTQMCAGLFENATGAEVKLELYIDKKPSGFALAGERRQMSEADVMAAFGPGGSQS